jgi:hypothetical protein
MRGHEACITDKRQDQYTFELVTGVDNKEATKNVEGYIGFATDGKNSSLQDKMVSRGLIETNSLVVRNDKNGLKIVVGEMQTDKQILLKINYQRSQIQEKGH